MNLFQLVFKQMRQRALSTWLTMFSVLLGVSLATAVLILYRGGGALFGQTEFGFDILIGPPKGSPLQLVLNTVYQVDQSAGVFPYSVYEDLFRNRAAVKIAVPIAVGDTYKGHRIVATLPKLFGFDEEGNAIPPENVLEYKVGKRYELAEGKAFHARKFEAVIGADISQRTGLKLGDKFQASHGTPQPGTDEDEHEEQWTVVGVLKKTFTAADRVIYIPLVTFYAIGEHEKGMERQAELRARLEGTPPPAPPATTQAGHGHEEPFHLNPDGTIELELPREAWQLSAIIVKARSSFMASNLMYQYKVIDPKAVAVNPATEMRNFFETFFKGSRTVLLIIATLVSIVASVGILVSIYNSVSSRKKEIAILRALGATRTKILTLICLEAGLVGSTGAVLGLIFGHLIGGMGSVYLKRLLGEGIDWLNFGAEEWVYLLAVVCLSVLAGLVPALKAYRTPVATNLVAG